MNTTTVTIYIHLHADGSLKAEMVDMTNHAHCGFGICIGTVTREIAWTMDDVVVSGRAAELELKIADIQFDAGQKVAALREQIEAIKAIDGDAQ